MKVKSVFLQSLENLRNNKEASSALENAASKVDKEIIE